jgi:hypothetical protein
VNHYIPRFALEADAAVAGVGSAVVDLEAQNRLGIPSGKAAHW